MHRISFPLAVAAFFFGPGHPAAFADGMPIKNGRFVGGPTTVISLTREQASAIRDADILGLFKELVLSPSQRMALQKSAGAAPLKLAIYNTTRGEND